MLDRAVTTGELDVLSFGEILSQVVRGSCLDGLFVLHHGFDCECHLGTWESLILSFFTGNHWDREVIAEKCLVFPMHQSRLDNGFLLGFVRGMSFLPEKLSGA